MSKSPWNRNFQNWMTEEHAKDLGKRSRSAKRHEINQHEALKLYKRGLSDLRMASVLGVSKGDVYRWRKLNGLSSNMIRQPDDATPSQTREKK